MANEAVLMIETEIPIAFKVSDGTAIEKGSFLRLTESMTAIINSGSGDKCAGILVEEKILNDGEVTASLHYEGIFKCVAGASIAIGAPLMISGTVNKLITATGVNGASIVGYALEAPSGDNQTFLAFIRIAAGGAIS